MSDLLKLIYMPLCVKIVDCNHVGVSKYYGTYDAQKNCSKYDSEAIVIWILL